MSGFISFEEVKDRVSIEQAVELLELDLKPRNNQLRGQCPICETCERLHDVIDGVCHRLN